MKNSRCRNTLDGDGPIVERARQALALVAGQFGEITDRGRARMRVATADDTELVFEYESGNYIFSRVYNLRITTNLPAGSAVPAGIEVSYRGKDGPGFVTTSTGASTSAMDPTALADLNSIVRDHLRGIDLLSAQVVAEAGRRVLHLTPMGGSFVWVLIPPVFKATAFPPGEVDRILSLVRAFHEFTSAETSKGPHT
ncbi:hypothetical protein DFO66_11263 [Brevibacterium sanguinis]|uniref:Uncharacterized protein n=2 Tax=Brevibacterium TaxID=1696 RepID=A0A366IG73_9MICO|nr:MULTISPECIES: hypothetical protein [Brevibacterium]RBP62959.1 hypothetical protein DFO66_11263 [Brevibacterium sanguinis]RBP69496.1 hypothetical protein DFO65_11230 [Brevibacterium celere]